MILSTGEINRLSQKELTQNDIEYFKKKYGKKFVKAMKAVDEGKVLKYQFQPSESSTWVVKGKRRQYLVIPDIYCTCRSFYQEVVISGETIMCYHLLAQKIAETRNLFRHHEATDAERRELYVEWRRTD
jgi:predicted nucleic acid-binding Zn finger protein